ncbi:MAG: HEAT repeat domain-containing protein [Spirochaetaceae bacterium]|nr:HEAT repeat domain-containing protein [Spirochaetaceae bacterium]
MVFSLAPLFAQEMSVEDSFLQESVEIQIIRETASSNDRETKLQALDFIKKQLDAGVKTQEIREILRDLAGEGTYRQERVDGRLANRYTDVRIRAAEYLGSFPKEQAAPILGEIIRNEKESSVITEAIYSLAKTKAYDALSQQTVEKYFREFHNRKAPDNRLAAAVLNYYAGIPNPKPDYVWQTVRDIASRNSNYALNVRNLANNLLTKMMSGPSK